MRFQSPCTPIHPRALLFPLVLFASACMATAGGSAEESEVQDTLDELIERTNELETFHIVYDTEVTKKGEVKTGTTELVLSEPHLGFFRMSVEEGFAESWIVDHVWYIRLSGEGWKMIPLPERAPASELLDELCPPAPNALGAGLVFEFNLVEQPEGDGFSFSLSINDSRTSRSCVLGWLADLKGHVAEIELDGGELVRRSAHFEMRVSREHGFPTLIVVRNDEETVSLRLRECYLNEELEESLTYLPDAARDAEIELKFVEGMDMPPAKLARRRAAFKRVSEALDAGDLSWDLETRERWSSLLVEVHRGLVLAGSEGDRELGEAEIGRASTWARECSQTVMTAEDRTSLEAEIAEVRAEFMGLLRRAAVAYQDSLPALDPEPQPELFEVELEVMTELAEEILVTPLMASFDAAMDNALDGTPQ